MKSTIQESLRGFNGFMQQLQQDIQAFVAQQVEAQLEKEVTERLVRAYHERRQQVSQRATGARCQRCGSQQAKDFSRNGHRARQLVSGYGVLNFWLPLEFTSVPPVILLDAIWVDVLQKTEIRQTDTLGRQRVVKTHLKVCVLVALGLYPQSNRWGVLGWEVADSESQAFVSCCYTLSFARWLVACRCSCPQSSTACLNFNRYGYTTPKLAERLGYQNRTCTILSANRLWSARAVIKDMQIAVANRPKLSGGILILDESAAAICCEAAGVLRSGAREGARR